LRPVRHNGQVERINRILIPMLNKIVNKEKRKQWYKLLYVEYAINNSKNRSTGETSCRLLFGIDQRGRVNDEIKEYVNANVNV